MKSKLRAPRWLLLAIAFLIFTQLISAIGLLSLDSFYAALEVSYPMIFRLGLSLGWTVILTGLVIGLWRRKPEALFLAAPVLTVYASVGVILQTVYARSTYSRGTLSFDAVVAALTLIPVWWITLRRGWLRATRPPQGTD